ncbi:Integrator complex subunit 2-like protein [Dinothrombium tinctorium]|uniref:Integrator complex subunit 2-like protein n=1 Tax=Dinothrombium tinctorium TaxID=1965070 RepID=A0A443RJN8_9ACAR|nr:Integrator complex subunit 2-like protein [Dinothrombium tinctorium]
MEVSAKAFKALNDIDIDSIKQLSDKEMRPLLPCLVRMALCVSIDTSDQWVDQKKCILQVLSETDVANSIVSLLSVDFHALEIDVKKEQQFRSKLGSHPGDSVLVSSLVDGLALEFEKSDGIRRLRLVLSELLAVQSYIRSIANSSQAANAGIRASELFDNDVYIDDVSDVMCIAVAELTNSLQLIDVCETLLYVKNGLKFICRLVANASETFHEVSSALLANGEKQDEESFIGRTRMEVLQALCRMNPSHSLVIRSEAIEMCRMPGLSVLLTLDHLKKYQSNQSQSHLQGINDLVSFISGILLGGDDKVRSWFAQYVRIGQKKMETGSQTTLLLLRQELLKSLNFVLQNCLSQENRNDSFIMQGSALLRLYCALRGVAAIKFTEEETIAILNLITHHPPSNSAGVRFASIALCMLLSCPSLITTQEAERKTVEWIQWLVKEESLFGQVSGVRSSFGEMLLLIAIHFHSNQLNAISELVCSTLGMKLPIRPNNMARMKIIFTQEVFTDQMVTAHAVKVPVIPNLNSNIPGFLPVHCIYQLLKNRAFTKHKVPIKEWIFRQICKATPPINPVLPPLLEAFVNSIIIPYSKSSVSTTNEPISEEEIMSVFSYTIYSEEDTKEVTRMEESDAPSCILTTQLLLLYYVLLYEDVRLSNMKAIVSNERKVLRYSADILSKIPVFHLMQEARRDEQNFGVLFPSLLRLISTHYPQLCLVQDWLKVENKEKMKSDTRPFSIEKEKQRLENAFKIVDSEPQFLIKVFDRLLTLPSNRLWRLASTFVSNLPILLPETVPKQVLEKAKKVWWRLNSIFPDSLRVMTVNAFSPPFFGTTKLSWKEIVLDPLTVLRCDSRVFRCPEIIEIFLHMLNAFLTASRTYFGHHLLEKPSRSPEEEKDREELRFALISAQESAAIQILLECCLPTNKEEENNASQRMTEVQRLVCVHLHQVFISDPNLAKLVHFQGYPSQLLSLTYPITKSLSAAKLCFNVSYTLLTLLASEKRAQFFIPVLPALVRMCKPFPPLRDEAENMLTQLSQICLSRLAATCPTFLSPLALLQKYSDSSENITNAQLERIIRSLPSDDPLSISIKHSYNMLCEMSAS